MKISRKCKQVYAVVVLLAGAIGASAAVMGADFNAYTAPHVIASNTTSGTTLISHVALQDSAAGGAFTAWGSASGTGSSYSVKVLGDNTGSNYLNLKNTIGTSAYNLVTQVSTTDAKSLLGKWSVKARFSATPVTPGSGYIQFGLYAANAMNAIGGYDSKQIYAPNADTAAVALSFFMMANNGNGYVSRTAANNKLEYWSGSAWVTGLTSAVTGLDVTGATQYDLTLSTDGTTMNISLINAATSAPIIDLDSSISALGSNITMENTVRFSGGEIANNSSGGWDVNIYSLSQTLAPGTTGLTGSSAGVADGSRAPALLPVPQKMRLRAGEFRLTPETKIYADDTSRKTGEYLAAQLRKSTGYRFEVVPGTQTEAVQGAVLLTTKGSDAKLGPEGYELTVDPDSVVIRAPQQAGNFYGAQTLLQLLPPEIFATQAVAGVSWTMPCVQIEDQPRFKWRGMLLDVGRHFFTKEEVEKVLDTLALLKINTFHWHLVDNPGWRIEIKKYPRLTEIGAWRKDIGFGLDPKSSTAYGPDGRYGGFYTQNDIREIVAYAAARHIMIVPEIEMPGHCMAALEAYPELRCDPHTKNAAYCVGKDSVFEFLQNVLTEVIELFPGQYIHIGGDEVKKDNWQMCAKCQARIKAEGLNDEEELQSYFIQRIEKFINAKGKTMIGWSEILQGGLAQNATVMDWKGGAKEAASTGHDVVMSPTTACYFDYYQSEDQALEPKAMRGVIPLKRVYAYEPLPADLDPAFHSRILGAQGNLWTEFIPSLNHLEYMMFPRLAALAEVTWSPKDTRNWDNFNRRLQEQFQRFDQLGVNYRHERPEPSKILIGEWTPAQITTQGGALEWDVSEQIAAPGTCRVSLNYTRGSHGLELISVALLENGLEIARDVHTGFTGSGSHATTYTLKLTARKIDAKYTIRAQVAGRGGTDSFGNVFWSFQPVTEKP